MSPPIHVPHPGVRIRSEVIPAGISVTEAAERLDVSRPALSNLLNGKAALTADMATRLEKAFGYSRGALMRMQADFDAAHAAESVVPKNVKALVPPFLQIKANDIVHWVTDKLAPRSRLAVFLRTLVHSTGTGLTHVDFPGNDDAERHGWDGEVIATQANAWIPLGHSVWEFGTNDDPKKKAEDDFKKTIGVDAAERAETVFIFVTPRRWKGKEAWAAEKRAKHLWKDVLAYDASDLEQWLEQSLPGQAWFAGETGSGKDRVRSLEHCWNTWANATEPPLSPILFRGAVEAHRSTIESRLAQASSKPIVIAADSTDEALAFLSEVLSEGSTPTLATLRDRAIVFDRPGVLPTLAIATQGFIPIVYTGEVQRELATLRRTEPAFVLCPRNAPNTTPDVVLETVDRQTFNEGLADMGLENDTARLAEESGRSLTVLRRRLSQLPGMKSPPWAESDGAHLVPFLFAGVWNSDNEADCRTLSELAGGVAYDALEKEFQRLAGIEDAPLWSIGKVRGVVSKVDLLYAIGGTLTRSELDRFFAVAETVLGEDDPALDLEPSERWAAAIHEKKRAFSSGFREGIRDSLLILAVHGPALFDRRLGTNVAWDAAKLVRKLLRASNTLTLRVLEANEGELPTYAEAAPREFLDILMRDIQTDASATKQLMQPVQGDALWTRSSRCGLLWALETLAWNPDTLTDVAFLLAELSEIEINDNLSNKPINSLASIFRSRMPQTAAPLETRLALIRELAKRHPTVVWKLCTGEFGDSYRTGHYSHKPRWRDDVGGHGEPSTVGESRAFVREMVELALTWQPQTLQTLVDLVERLHALADEDQERVWNLITRWANDGASEADKAALREKIRVATLSRRAAVRAKHYSHGSKAARAGKAAYAALEPADLLHRHAWLFRTGWVEESADEIEEFESYDFGKREERIEEHRVRALKEIYAARGLPGLLELSKMGQGAWILGRLLPNGVLDDAAVEALIRMTLPAISGGENVVAERSLSSGMLFSVEDDDRRWRILTSIARDLTPDDTAQLLMLAPFRKSTWALVDQQTPSVRMAYWKRVSPVSAGTLPGEAPEGVDRLLAAERPWTAFGFAQYQMEDLDGPVVFRLLSALAQSAGPQDNDAVNMDRYYVQQAFEILNCTPSIALDDKAALEFAFLEALVGPGERHDKPGIPNLERYVEEHPEFFVQAIVWTYRRDDGAADPPEWQVPGDQGSARARRAHRLLDALRVIPGSGRDGGDDFRQLMGWINAVRSACTELARREVADICLGKLLSHCPEGRDGVWPNELVRDAMETLRSEQVTDGAHTGMYNSRGVHSGGKGGEQERALAGKFKRWANSLRVSHRFVAAKLLDEVARTYDGEAERNDVRATLSRRLR
jgi:addiction module HigA family antidote